MTSNIVNILCARHFMRFGAINQNAICWYNLANLGACSAKKSSPTSMLLGFKNCNKTQQLFYSTTQSNGNDKDAPMTKQQNAKIVLDNQKLTSDRKLLKLMDLSQFELAVEFLKKSVDTDPVDYPMPNGNTITRFLNQLANFGEVEPLLKLYDLVVDNHISCSVNVYFKYLVRAYHRSGRPEEGINTLKLFYFKTSNFESVEAYFVALTVMIIRYFPDELTLILEFVAINLKEMKINQVLTALWKCYVITGKFKEAENMVKNNKDLLQLLPSSSIDILQNTLAYEVFDVICVSEYLLELELSPSVRRDKKIKKHIMELYLQHLCKFENWDKLIIRLKECQELDTKPRIFCVKLIWSYLQSADLSTEQCEYLNSFLKWYQMDSENS